MAFDGNGNFLRLYSWVADKANGIPITASRVDGEDSGFAAGLTLCVTRDGQGKPTANFLPVSDLSLNLGSASLRWAQINGLLTFSANNNITQGAPTSGPAYSIFGAAGSYVMQLIGNSTSGQSLGHYVRAGTSAADFASRIQNVAASQDYQVIQGDGQQYIFSPPAYTPGPANTFQTGYMDEPQNGQNGNYTLALTDRGKQIYKSAGAASTLTIPANASVAFPAGAIIRLVNISGANLTIAITTDTLIWLPSAATGSRTLATNGAATIEKVDSTHWIITGVGLS